MIGLLTVFALLVTAFGVLSYTSFTSGHSGKARRILTELGMKNSKEEGSQYYKWGWHEERENRVSAEHMVKQAFQNACVWLDNDDLAFFEKQCSYHAADGEVDEELIEDRIERIIKRSERVRRWVSKEIRNTIQRVNALNPQEASDMLALSNIKTEPNKALARLIKLELKRQLYNYGAQILTLNAAGLTVEDPQSSQTFLLEGVDSWAHLAHMFCEEVLSQSTGRHYSIQPAIAKALHETCESGSIQGVLQDLHKGKDFLKSIHEQFQSKELAISYETAQYIDAVLYGWKFDEGTQFRQENHDMIRNFFTRMDLAPRFREIIAEKFEDRFSSLHKLLRLFPRNVIFYGGTPASRSFATDQYSRHYLALLEAMGFSSEKELVPPSIIWINEEQVEKMRQGPKKGTKAVTLASLITNQQRIHWLEQGISEKVAAKRGWIINLEIEDPLPEELDMFNHEPFRSYQRFFCDAGEDVDFMNNTYNAKKTRIQFFDLIIDALTEMPSLQEARKSHISSQIMDPTHATQSTAPTQS